MSKFTIKVELQGLKIEVEGTKEDAPKLAQAFGQQLGSLIQPSALLAASNDKQAPALEAETVETDTRFELGQPRLRFLGCDVQAGRLEMGPDG